MIVTTTGMLRSPSTSEASDPTQEDPDLASFLEEAFNSSSPTIAARRPPTAGAAASDMLTLGIDDELTEEEELVGGNGSSSTCLCRTLGLRGNLWGFLQGKE